VEYSYLTENQGLKAGGVPRGGKRSLGRVKDSQNRGPGNAFSFQQYSHIKQGERFAGWVPLLAARERKKSLNAYSINSPGYGKDGTKSPNPINIRRN
jgi:hypothetical protein